MKSPCKEYRRLLGLRRLLALILISLFHHSVRAQVMGDAVDVSQDFQKMDQVYFIGEPVAASFRLAPDEKIFGCGESFT
jgi:hypothetical protein